jgi:hypothetical protein
LKASIPHPIARCARQPSARASIMHNVSKVESVPLNLENRCGLGHELGKI